ncbi:GNAT family N-acetyltransferase [Aurantibacter sp.]|uniref:GNAT family N-acetyltransferase n=1 Tax=Aurantibacter sp. TaxID=2807103 RepID=UPI0035C87177
MDFEIRMASKNDMPQVLDLIQELAEFEKEPNAVFVSVEELQHNGFGANPIFKCFVATYKKNIIGIALTYIRYSTWKGKTLHLEDLVVKEAYRGSGLGSKLLDEVVKLGKQLKVRRVSWEVLDWNAPAINFYKSRGAKILEDWHLVQLDEQGIQKYLEKL